MAAQTQNHAAGTPATILPAHPLVTTTDTFFEIPSEGGYLFSVNGGLRASTALNIASCLLASSVGILSDIGADPGKTESDCVYGARFLNEAAHALINAVVRNIERAEGVQS